jgi:hypothetical protein
MSGDLTINLFDLRLSAMARHGLISVEETVDKGAQRRVGEARVGIIKKKAGIHW